MMPPPTRTLSHHIKALEPHWDVHRPEGAGPFPAIIQLHGCGGRKPFLSAYADIANRNGVAVLAIDSHAPRRISQMEAYATVCTGMQLPGHERAADLFAAMAWLKQQSWVDQSRIAAAGWSHGGWTISDALSFQTRAEMTRATGIEDPAAEPLHGLSALFLVYPYLGPLALHERGWRLSPRVTAILCGRDMLAVGPWPRRLLAHAKARGADVEIINFETATHAFDEPEAQFAALAYSEAYVARAHETRRETDAFAQLQRPRFLGDERIRSRLDDEAVDAFGGDRPAQPPGGFQQSHTHWPLLLAAQLHQTVRRRHASDATTDDGDVAGMFSVWSHLAHDEDPTTFRRTTSASMSMNSG